MAKSKIIQQMIRYEGTTQDKRVNKSLDPGSFELMDYDIQKWMAFAYDFAKEVNFFSTTDDKKPSTNWQSFFADKDKIQELLLSESDGNTEPQLALFISFLRLLEESRSRFNLLPKRHLDFYYQEVLQIHREPAISDQAHVFFQLAKKAKQVLIPKGSLLDAGKDKNNNAIIFKTQDDLLVNQIKITELKSVYVNKSKQLFYAENAKMKDGIEAEFGDPKEGWHPFGHDKTCGADHCLASPKIGFFMGSSLLQLSEGVRTIGISFNTDSKKYSSFFSAEITGENGWMPLINSEDMAFESHAAFENKHQICFQLPAFEKATAAYSQDVHGENYDTDLPVIRFYYKHKSHKLNTLSLLKTESCELQVYVKGITELKSQNAQGLLNTKKTFMPFGALPKKGANWYVNHKELNDRIITDGTLYVNRAEDSNFDISLSENTVDMQKSSLQFIIKNQPVLTNYMPNFYFTNYALKTSPASGLSQLNFLQKNITDKGLKLELKTEHNLIAKVNVKTTGSDTNKTYTIDQKQGNNIPPTLESIYLDYTAKAIDLSFGHIHPFGSHMLDNEKDKPLVPDEYINKSFFYMGLENAQILDTVSILFQVKEGSENPLKTPPKLTWEILTNTGWKTQQNEEFLLLEETNHFIKTGLVKLKIPKTASSESTLMPSNRCWIRAHMSGDYDALCKLIDVKAQAILAERVLNPKTENSSHLPAERISKMINRLAQTKAVIQPFASFNGKAKETNKAYYLRVSERLRHKNRAVSVWDYERLLLEEFPSIYKVKTLNHSTFIDGKLYNKAPGCITIVVIPDLTKRSVFDIYEPRFPASELSEMKNFLIERVGGQVEVSVINPQFRKVRITAKVKFYEGKDENYFKKATEKDITRFLSPWAFDINSDIVFNTSVHSSSLLYYLENLDYIDYIENLKIEQEKQTKDTVDFEIVNKEATTIKPHQILVSDKSHNIEIGENICDY